MMSRQSRFDGGGRIGRFGRFGKFGKLGKAMIAAVVLTLGLSGCMGPDLSSRADDIGAVLAASPGVDDVKTIYQNGLDSGKNFHYTVTMSPDATTAQATEVAAALDRESNDDFDGYDQKLVLRMPSRTVTISDRTNSDIVAQRTPRLLDLMSTLSLDSLVWKEGTSDKTTFGNTLDIGEPQPDPYRAVDAVRAQFGSEVFELRMRSPADADWSVKFPFSEQAQAGMESDFVPLLDKMTQINIEGDQVSLFYAVVPDGDDVVGRLRGIIELIDSTTHDPWSFYWVLGQSPSDSLDYSTAGLVSVGGCEYDDDRTIQRTQAAEDIEEQLRDIYDTCFW